MCTCAHKQRTQAAGGAKTRVGVIQQRTYHLLILTHLRGHLSLVLFSVSHQIIAIKAAGKDTSTQIPSSQYRFLSTTTHSVGARTAPCRSDVRTTCTHARAQGIFLHKLFQASSTRKRTHRRRVPSSITPVENYHIVPFNLHFSKKLLVKPSRAPLRLITIFLLHYSSQRFFLTWKNPLRSITVMSIKIDVRFDPFYSHLSRGTALSPSSFHNAQIVEALGKKAVGKRYRKKGITKLKRKEKNQNEIICIHCRVAYK